MRESHDSEEESGGLLGRSEWITPKRRWNDNLARQILALSVSFNVIFSGLGTIFWFQTAGVTHSSYETGFHSDLEAVTPHVGLKMYAFSGGVELDSNGSFFAHHESQQYVGTPSPEVDQAWGSLLSGLNIDLGGLDKSLEGKTFQWPDSGSYFTGLEVFHSLHCLNRLRQALYPKYYSVFNNPNDPSREDHIGHCINHLRQAIQCHADLTPMEWKLVGNKIILNTETHHTCRDFDRIHKWAAKRQTRFEDIDAVRNGSLFIVD